jgi:hypothetical protein
VKHNISRIEHRKGVAAWDAKVDTHHTVTYNMTPFKDSDIMMYITIVSQNLVQPKYIPFLLMKEFM